MRVAGGDSVESSLLEAGVLRQGRRFRQALEVDPAMGCGVAQCGACTVHIDGEPTRSCVLPHDSLADAQITTIEGLEGPAADAIRAAWIEDDVPQCGYCQSGQIMAATKLIAQNNNPSDAEIDAAMTNLCRCATYMSIRRAIKKAAAKV